jgi:hypothetical protein
LSKQPIWLLLLACVFALVAAFLEVPRDSAAGERSVRRAGERHVQSAAIPTDYLLDDIAQYRHETWRWQALMGLRRSHARAVRHVRNPRYRKWVRNLWRKRALTHRRKAFRPPHHRAWQCLQRHEGAWNDSSAPYYGGLQMDISFQRAYGAELLRRKGTADNWTPVEQMWVAERAYRAGRGFYPWPNTARYCGLI